MLILTAADIRQALPMRTAIETQKRAYVAVATRAAALPLRTAVSIPDQAAVSLFMPARVGDDLGAKIVSVFPKNVASGRPIIHGLVILIDPATGQPAALLDARYLTALRTAAATAAATDRLARPEARVAALLGSGTLARTHLLALNEIRPLSQVRIYSRDPNHVAAFIEAMRPHTAANLIAARSPADAVREADLICCVTTSSTPVFDGRDLKAGTHVNGVGSYTRQMQEVDSQTVSRAGNVFVDSRESVLAEAGDVVLPIAEGRLTESDLIEIGAVLAGQHPGRTSADAITFFKSCGLAAQDLTAAGEVLRRAREMGLGTEVDLN